MTKKINIYLYVTISILAIIVFFAFVIPFGIISENNKIRNSVHIVKITAENDNFISQCGGVIISNGYILTVAHPFTKTNSSSYDDLLISAYDPNTDTTFYPKIIKLDEKADLAILSDDKIYGSDIKIADNSRCSDKSLSYIHYADISHSLKKCRITGLASDGKRSYVSINTEIKNGYSGYPVTNKSGLLIGIICSYDSMNKITYAIPCFTLREFLKNLPSSYYTN